MILLIITSCLISCISGYVVGYILAKNKIFKILNKGTGRMGIIKLTQSILEIEEVSVAGTRTKIIIHDVILNRDCLYSKDDVLRMWGLGDWVQTSTIIWYDDNAQKIRDSKLELILDK